MRVFGFALFVFSIFIFGMYSNNIMYKSVYGDINTIVRACENSLPRNEDCILIAVPLKENKE